MQCPQCHADNPNSNRFCGMCGAQLQAKKTKLEANPYFSDRIGAEPVMKHEFSGPDTGREVAVAAVEESYANEPSSFPEPVREYRLTPPPAPATVAETQAPVVQAPPPAVVTEPVRGNYRVEPVVIGGSSMLGLGAPSQPLYSDSRGEDTSYLFDERPSRTVSWRAWALLLVLVGLGYLGYRQWSGSHYRNPQDLASVLAEGGRTTAPDTPVTPKPEDDKNAPAAANPGSTPDDGAKAASPNSAPAAGDSAKAPASDSANTSAAKPATEEKNANAASETPATSNSKPAPAPVAKAKDEDAGNTDQPKPSAKASAPAAAASVDYAKDPMYVRGMQYIHGSPQNCDMGLNYLKAAADSNPKARIQMAALYESGVCVPMDRAQAYKWFSKAQEMDPHNMWLEKSRSQLWSQMSDAERARTR